MIVAGAVLGVVSAFIGFLLSGASAAAVAAAASRTKPRRARRCRRFQVILTRRAWPSADKNPPAAKRKKAASVSPESLVEVQPGPSSLRASME